MIAPKTPKNEPLRQQAVEKYGLLDTLPEESFDSITRLLSYICDVPISLITLLDRDRNFLKSHHGIPFNESPRDISFCGHAINTDDPIMIVEDSRNDERFRDNPLVVEHGAIFYAGVPLVNNDGYKLGTLCVYDNKPRKLEPEQIGAMFDLSKQVMNLYEQKYNNIRLKKLQIGLEERNENLKRFASVVSHDLKSPLSNIVMLTDLLKEENQDNLNEISLQYLDHLKSSSLSLRDYIDGLLKYYKSDHTANRQKESIKLTLLFDKIKQLIPGNENILFEYPKSQITIYSNKTALEQIFLNLVNNAIKYNNKDTIKILISFKEADNHYTFSVRDNGNGISESDQSKLFELFSTLGKEDRYGNIGSGIGLATVKKIISSMGGSIQIISEVTSGSEFRFTIPK